MCLVSRLRYSVIVSLSVFYATFEVLTLRGQAKAEAVSKTGQFK